MIVTASSSNGDSLFGCSASRWDSLIESTRPATLLVAIEARISASLRRRLSAEDILQEALLHAWRDRAAFRFGDQRSFRRWLLKIIDRRILCAAEANGAQKRAGEVRVADLGSNADASETGGSWAGPMATTRPSRVVETREQARAIEAAIEALPAELREVYRLRVIEDLEVKEIATKLGLGESAIMHRVRRASEIVKLRLVRDIGHP